MRSWPRDVLIGRGSKPESCPPAPRRRRFAAHRGTARKGSSAASPRGRRTGNLPCSARAIESGPRGGTHPPIDERERWIQHAMGQQPGCRASHLLRRLYSRPVGLPRPRGPFAPADYRRDMLASEPGLSSTCQRLAGEHSRNHRVAGTSVRRRLATSRTAAGRRRRRLNLLGDSITTRYPQASVSSPAL